MKIKIYLSSNRGLPNLKKSLAHITDKLAKSDIPKENFQIIDSDPDEFEYPALNRLWLDSHIDNFYGLYLHCKGASKTRASDVDNGLAWADYMLYGLLDNYKVCIDHMRQSADLVGAMWYRHFKGNFFWIRSDYARKLQGPYNLYGANATNRYSAEYWCSQSYWHRNGTPLPKVKNLYYLPLNTDQDFLNLSKNKYVPSLTDKNKCTNLTAAIASNNYTIYDNIEITRDDFEKNQHELDKYTNYDSTIIIK
jgi:hypothetical protein